MGGIQLIGMRGPGTILASVLIACVALPASAGAATLSGNDFAIDYTAVPANRTR